MIEINCSDITEEFFEQKCLRENLPCIIRNCSSALDLSLLKQALAFTEKLATDDNPAALSCPISGTTFGGEGGAHGVSSQKQLVADTEVDVEVSFRHYERMKLKDFFSRNPGLLTQLLPSEQSAKISPQTEQQQQQSPLSTPSATSWYLKDWHFAEWFQRDVLNYSDQETTPLQLYQLPDFMRKFAQDDVLQKFQRRRQDHATSPSNQNDSSTSVPLPRKYGAGQEYRFIYAGGGGSATLPHFDVCATYSWSLNLRGTKTWKFFASREINEAMLKRYFLGDDDSDDDGDSGGGGGAAFTQRLMIERGQFDTMESLLSLSSSGKQNKEGAHYFSSSLNSSSLSSLITTVTQNADDIIFVPALWIHEVRNVALTTEISPSSPSSSSCVSVNHNWYVMPYSLPYMMRLLSNEVKTTLKMIGGLEILKQDKEEWAKIFNLTMQGSSNWCLNVVKEFLEFCFEYHHSNIEAEKIECLVAIQEALKFVNDLEKKALTQ